MWPKAPREYVFLAAAFHEVGRLLFGEDWSGREAFRPEMPVAKALAEATTQRVSFAPPPIKPGLSMTRSDGRGFTMEEVQAAKRRWNEHCDAVREAAKPGLEVEAAAAAFHLRRRNEVVAWIADRARNGELMTFGLWTGLGSPPRQLPPSIWNRVNDWDLFANCEVKTYVPGDPIARNFFLFFKRDSVDRAIADLAPKLNNRGGSKPKYPWSDFIKEAVRQLDEEGDFGPDWSQTDLEERMALWCQQNWPEVPSETSIRVYVKKARAGFLKLRSGLA